MDVAEGEVACRAGFAQEKRSGGNEGRGTEASENEAFSREVWGVVDGSSLSATGENGDGLSCHIYE